MGGSGFQIRHQKERKSKTIRLTGGKLPKDSKPIPSKAAKTSKFKKPKHLQRKIESLPSHASDKERLLQDLREFEKIKQQKLTRRTGVSTNPTRVNVDNGVVKHESRTKHKQEKKRRIDPANPSNASLKRERLPNYTQVPAQATSPVCASGVEAPVELAVEEKAAIWTTKPQQLDGNHSSDDDDQPLANTRQRGKRRRGRVNAIKSLAETSDGAPDKADHKNEEEDSIVEIDATEASIVESTDSLLVPKRPRENDGRRCLGRKPVTDFHVGKSYPAKVVYAKPFGVFMDVGCHSDAFCHVSRLSDEYTESPETLFTPGLAIQAARVVQVDRARKRITVTLRQTDLTADEAALMEANGRQRRQPNNSDEVVVAKSKPTTRSSDHPQKRDVSDSVMEPRMQSDSSANAGSVANAEERTDANHPNDLKRARKQARRASRRAERSKKDAQ
jgi:predicted RNA-binding protein with RPS1 domain